MIIPIIRYKIVRAMLRRIIAMMKMTMTTITIIVKTAQMKMMRMMITWAAQMTMKMMTKIGRRAKVPKAQNFDKKMKLQGRGSPQI